MKIDDLTAAEIETLAESLAYSKQRVADAKGTPTGVQKETLTRIEALLGKISAARRAQQGHTSS